MGTVLLLRRSRLQLGLLNLSLIGGFLADHGPRRVSVSLEQAYDEMIARPDKRIWLGAMNNLTNMNTHPKLINGRVWVPDSVFGGYQQLPETDPKYKEILLWIDSQRFVKLLDWVYQREKP